MYDWKLLCLPAVTLSSRRCMLQLSKCMYFSLPCQPLFLNTVILFVLFFVHHDLLSSHSFNAFDKHLRSCFPMVIYKIGWSIRSWLPDNISFSIYKSYCRHAIYWILVAFMIAALALIKVSRLYGLYRHLYAIGILTLCCYTVYQCEFIE